MLGRSITEMGSPWEDDPRRVSRRGLKTARSNVLRGPPLTGVGRYVNLDPMPGEVTTSVGVWAAIGLESRPQACQQHQDSRHSRCLARRPPPDRQGGEIGRGTTLPESGVCHAGSVHRTERAGRAWRHGPRQMDPQWAHSPPNEHAHPGIISIA